MPRAKKKASVEPSYASHPADGADNTVKGEIQVKVGDKTHTQKARVVKRVLIFSLTYFPRFVAGAEIALKEILERFNENNKGAHNTSFEYQFEMITLRIDSEIPKEEVIDNVRIHRIGYSGHIASDMRTIPIQYALNKYLFTFFACIKALSLHYKNPFHITWSIMANYAGFAALFFKKTTLWAQKIGALRGWFVPQRIIHIAKRLPQTIFVLTLQEGDPLSHMRRRVGPLWFLYRAIYKNADHIQAISNYLGLMAREVGYAGDVTVIPNGVNGAHFSKKIDPDRISEIRELWDTTLGVDGGEDPDRNSSRHVYAISTSRLVLKNAVDDIVRALALLPEDIRLVVCGVGPDQEMLEGLAIELGVAHRIIWQGFVDHTVLPEFLQAADVFVRPSLSEGFGNSFVEAMAAGIPVVGTNVGGIADFLSNENAYIVEPRNPQHIANAIHEILAHPRKAAEKASEARTLALTKYDWNTVGLGMRQLFDTLTLDGGTQVNIKPKRFVIATGIYPPDIGGPAQYAKQLNEALVRQGHRITICTFTTEKKLPRGIRHLWYFGKMLHAAYKADAVIALDTFGIALPALCAAKIMRCSFSLRVGGDFLWEQYVDRTMQQIVLSQFYPAIEKQQVQLSPKEKIIMRGTKWVFAHADAIMWSTAWQRDICAKPYAIDSNKSFIVENAYDVRLSPRKDPANKVFFGATRARSIKNIDRLKKAFKQAQQVKPEIDLAVDQVPDSKFLESVRAAYAVILVSLGDISPNMIMTAIRCGVPFIVTRETGIYDRIKECAIFIDPENEESITKAILWLADTDNYKEQCHKVRNFSFVRTYDDIASEIIKITATLS